MITQSLDFNIQKNVFAAILAIIIDTATPQKVNVPTLVLVMHLKCVEDYGMHLATLCRQVGCQMFILV